MRNKKTLVLMEIAIFGALAFVLDFIAFKMPQGGSVSLVMIPLVLMTFRRGIGAGIATGLLVGLLQILAGPSVAPLTFGFVVMQVILDYLLAYAVVGFAGVMRGTYLKGLKAEKKGRMVAAVIIGTLIASILRYLVHVTTGFLFFGMYAEGNPLVYSIVYNATYMIPLFLLTAAVCSVLFITAPRLTNPEL